uniref:CSD domain-containing protein n=1 Tax=Timema tahoe TaxID=61484 RepID=A0A7R9FK24_9NEOP|nr:unnamed protein product [Timema tahoe]
MADPEKQPEQPKAVQQKQVIATKVTGTVKWFNVKSGYGFINSSHQPVSHFLVPNSLRHVFSSSQEPASRIV